MPDPQDRTPSPSTDAPADLGHTLQTRHGSAIPAPEESAETLVPATEEALPALTASVEMIAGYLIEGELGRGGMGVVYKARQKGLGRTVALKMILHADHAGAEERARFEREAKALAGLRHEGIVQVYEVGEHQGKPFFSLEYVEGGSLDKHLGGTPLPLQHAARLVQKLAEAMQAAHEQGIVHRDLKPANILLTFSDASQKGSSPERFCEASLNGCVPRITDFGLAKKQDEGSLSASGAILGTPSYMAPEQARGKGKEIDARTDVYALGAILYECLTGRPPFKAASAMDTMLQVVADDPVPVRALQPATPRDLETVCLKCLHKEPGRRYASAQALADDLGRFRRREPVQARPVGRLERGWRWCRRNPVVAGLLTAVAVLLASGTTVSTWFGFQASARARDARTAEAVARKNADKERQARAAVERSENRVREALVRVSAKERDERLAKEKEKEARAVASRRLYVSQLSLAQSYWQEGNVAAARDKLLEAQEHRDTWEHRFLHTLMNHRGQRTFLGHTGQVYSVCFSPDGKHVASGSGDKTVKVWDAATGQKQLTLKGHTNAVYSVCFSPDGKRIASGSGGGWKPGELKVWDAQTGQQILSLKGHSYAVNSVCFSPDGKRIASGGYDNTVKVWNAVTGQEALTLKGHTDSVRSVAFSPDGKRIASGGYDKTVKVWDAATGQEQLTLKGHTRFVYSVCFSPDGQRLASGYEDNTVRVWDAATGEAALTLKGHTSFVRGVAFSPDGKRIASGSADRTVKVWDAASGQEALTLKGHTSFVNSVCFSPDNKRLTSASEDKTVKVWDAQTGQETLTLKGHTGAVFSVCFSPDGNRIASASHDRTVRVWDAQTGQQVLTFKGHTNAIYSVCFSPDGKGIASGSADRKVKVWDAATGQEGLTLRGHTGSVRSVCFSPDGKRLASASEDGTVKVWDAATGQKTLTLKGHTSKYLRSVCFSPDGKRLASASQDKTVKVWDAATGQETLTLKGHTHAVFSVCFSPDGKRLASGSFDNTVKVWDAATGQEQLTLKGHTSGVNSVAFSPDGKRLTSGGREFGKLGEVKVWDAASGQEALILKGHTRDVTSTCFSPDGKHLISQDEGGKQLTWDLATGQPVAKAREPAGAPSPRSPDGHFLVRVEGMLIRVYRLPLNHQEEAPTNRWWIGADYRWHAARARESWQASNWFAAAFHLQRQLPNRSWDARLHVRHAFALRHRGQPAESARHYLQAVLLDPGVRLWPLDPDAGRRGQSAAQASDWPQAVASLELAAHQPEATLVTWYSLLLARNAALKESRTSCREILDRFESNAAAAPYLASFCVATPCEKADALRLVKVAERMVARQRNASTLTWLGAAQYRGGRFEEAGRILQESIKAQGKGGYVDTWLFLAMVQQRFGQAADARASLSHFEKRLKGRKFATWQDTVRWRLLHEEARGLILTMPRSTE